MEYSSILTIQDCVKKSRIRETPIILTDADSRTDTNLKRLRDLSPNNFFVYVKGLHDFFQTKKMKGGEFFV